MLIKAHNWQLGNIHGENALHTKNEGIINYLTNIPDQKYWTVSFADFRGRLYQYGIWNPTGTKFNRSLLYFDNVSKIEPQNDENRSKYWMHVHAANSAGWNDKQSNQVRHDTTKENIDLIRKIANNPGKNIKLWENLDNPWQCLTAFIELDNIIAAGEENQVYYTGLPIFQDGSCNGLQHYAALAKDTPIANMVNLVDGEKPHDIYTVIAKRLAEKAGQDLDHGIYNGLPPKLKEKAKQLFIRSIVKRPIMTLPYGSTEFGWQNQIEEVLLEMTSTNKIDLSMLEIRQLKQYLQKKIKVVIEDSLKAAVVHQRWLDHLIKTANQMNIPIQWRNPLGTPLALRDFEMLNSRQKLNVKNKKSKPWNIFSEFIDTENPSHLAIWSELTKFDHPTNHTKNLAGFPPNYIHSLDAVHLKLANYDYRHAKSENELERSWLSIHDSFGSTASAIDDFNKYIRNAFVELYDYGHSGEQGKYNFLDDFRHQLISDLIESAMYQKYRMLQLKDSLEVSGVIDELQSKELGEKLDCEYRKVIEEFNVLPEIGDFDINDVRDSTYFFS